MTPDTSNYLWRAVLFISIAAVFAGCVFAMWQVRRSQPRSFVRTLLGVMVTIGLILGGLHALTWVSGLPNFFRWWWNLDQEYTLGATLGPSPLKGLLRVIKGQNLLHSCGSLEFA
jgi:putative copper export protein